MHWRLCSYFRTTKHHLGWKLSCSEREQLLQAARTLAPTIREKFKVQRKEIEAKREEDVKKRAEAIARKEVRAVQEKEKLAKRIEKLGLWINRTEIEDGLAMFVKQTKKKEALKLQINSWPNPPE